MSFSHDLTISFFCCVEQFVPLVCIVGGVLGLTGCNYRDNIQQWLNAQKEADQGK